MSNIYYDNLKLREYSAISNAPIIYCLIYEEGGHRIAGAWAHEWLTNYVRSSEVVAFHPYSLQLIVEKMSTWKNPFSEINDLEVFLQSAEQYVGGIKCLIQSAIQENRVLFLNKDFQPWSWQLSHESAMF